MENPWPKTHRHISTDSKEDVILTDQLGAVVTIGINRPEKRNCVNLETGHKLREAFEKFEENETAQVAVLYGKGGNFCAGFDLEQIASLDLHKEMHLSRDQGLMGPTRMNFTKPVVAAVSGYAVAGGLELALMCDLRVVEETAVMGVFCRRFGVPLLDGGTVRLPALIGLSRALDLILTGRGIKGKEAFEWGLANQIVACGTGFGQAVQLAMSLVKFPQECMRRDRSSAYHAAFSSQNVEEALKYELENAEHVIKQESIEGAKKFISGIGKHGNFNLHPEKYSKL